MDSSFWFDAINLRWSIVYIEESQVTISFFFFKSKFVFVLANSLGPDEMRQFIWVYFFAKVPVLGVSGLQWVYLFW